MNDPIVRMPVKSSIVKATLLVAILFVIGFATRMPALAFPRYYALHGVLAAPFYAALLTGYLRKRAPFSLFAVCVCIYGEILGAMQPIMAVTAIAPLIISGGVFAVTDRTKVPAWVIGFIFGACWYPCAVTAGAAMGSVAFSAISDIVPDIILAGIACGLAFLGALAAVRVVPSSAQD